MARQTILAGGSIAIDGLADTIGGLRKVSKDIGRVANKASRLLIDDVVVPTARANWQSQRVKPSVANQAVKAQGTATSAGVSVRYSRFPYAAGIEYGSKQYRQFNRWRGNRFTVAPGSSTGYVAQDAIRTKLPEVEEKWVNAVSKAINQAVDATG